MNVAVWLLWACAETPAPLEGVALARRTSLDLRGVPPELSELDEVEADAGALAGLRARWRRSPAFEERLVQVLGARWRTRVDTFDIVAYDYGLAATDEYAWERAVGEEPLRLMARVVTEDLPWSTVVTADWTMAQETLGATWPLDYPEDAEGWRVAHYTDGRPPVGVLATNGLWWRYTTTNSNMNRGRAAALSRLLLCEDFLARPVSFAEADTTTATTAEAARSDPYCLACHASLDPIAASLFGFWWLSLYSELEETSYHAEREGLWASRMGVAPAWFGTPISGLPDLGVSIANDPRFARCAVRTMAEGFWRRALGREDDVAVEVLRQAFVSGGGRAGALIDGVLRSPVYAEPGARLLTHDQLVTSVEALTGYRWRWEGADVLDLDARGYRQLLGGVDGVSITEPQAAPGLTWALVVKRLAEAAADHVVRVELEGDGPRRLFGELSLDDLPGDAAFDAALDTVHRRAFGTRPDDAWRDSVTGLWNGVAATDGAAGAWRAVVAVTLRDPAFVAY